ncbi:hypothetical protein LMH87_003462 [Akanthomyces muscarius]|uniref:GATA-type domain-containing protein n=1 Tax=Akanthomyces muscarius TaxID=2231603 RepID=A0A9W8UGM2_AKAMU|nr:hypothetical protein LMH87_003462 [Akanthomyces muscarius]KAJ4144583.1 hypothetical protein LMH87_003462 [Akanthomyces muscarius]
MTREGDDTHSLSSPQKRPEQYRPSVSRLKLGETLQPIRRTAQDLYLFRDNVGGRSALVHDSNPAESHNDDGRQRHGKAKSPGHASHGGQKSPGAGESHHIKIHQRRRSGADGNGAGSTAQHSHFRHLSTDISCHQCGEVNSPEWRPGPQGPGTLCNVCGLIYAKQESHRRRDKTKSENTRKHRASI